MNEPGEAIFTVDHLGFITVEFDPPDARVVICTREIIEDYIRSHNEGNILKHRLRSKEDSYESYLSNTQEI